jgi:hypothetical protein
MYVRLISPSMIQSSQGNGSIDDFFNDTHCGKEHRSKLTNGGMICQLPHCFGNGFYIYLQMKRIRTDFYSVGHPLSLFQFTTPILRAVKDPPRHRPPSPFFSPFLISATSVDLCATVVFSLLYHIHVFKSVKFHISNQKLISHNF